MTHVELKNAILADIGSEPDILVWPNPVGVGRLGFKPPSHGQPEAIIKFGAGTGSADILGIQLKEPWARPFAIEVKIGRDKASDEQNLWSFQWQRLGGLYIIARAVEQPRAILWG